jgi:hypothetical protein
MEDRSLKIDDFVITDIPGIMKVYDAPRNLGAISSSYYSRPCWITVEDKPNKDKEGHQRQTKMLHTPSGIVLDMHERDPRGLFFCHFGPNSQEHYELRKFQMLSHREKGLINEYKSKLQNLLANVEFAKMR